MRQRVDDLAESLAALASTVERLDRRVAALEGRQAPDEEPRRVGAPAAPAAAGWRPEVLAYAGRSFLVLGGAYLLRALAESGALAPSIAVGLGILYGWAWMGAASRAAGAQRRLDAFAHGLTAAAVAFPLALEATVRFHLLAPAGGALVIAADLVLLLAVAWHRRLHALAWVAVGATLVAAVASMAGTGVVVPYAAVLVLAGGLVLWSGRDRDWPFLSLLAAVAADLAALAACLGALAAPEAARGAAFSLLLALAFGYLASFSLLVARGVSRVDAFVVGQSAAVLGVGLGGAVWLARPLPSWTVGLGWAAAGAAVAAYGLAFGSTDRSRRGAFHYFASIGLLLLVVATGLLLPAEAFVWAGLAVLHAILARRFHRASLAAHAALLAAVAAVASGLASWAGWTLLAPAERPWQPPSWAAGAALLAAIWCLVWPVPRTSYGSVVRRAARLALLVVAVWGGAACALYAASAIPALRPGDGADAGLVAVLRTFVLAAAVLGLAWGARRPGLAEGRWLVAPVLWLGGAKLLFEDFASGRPATLVLSLSIFGLVLILAPRVARESARRLPLPPLDEAAPKPGPAPEAGPAVSPSL